MIGICGCLRRRGEVRFKEIFKVSKAEGMWFGVVKLFLREF